MSTGDTRHLLSPDNGKGRDDTSIDPDLKCLNEGPDCKGTVEYRMPLSGTGKSFPRCDKHWDDRLDQEQGLRERYPEHPPSDWSPLDAGESWDEEY